MGPPNKESSVNWSNSSTLNTSTRSEMEISTATDEQGCNCRALFDWKHFVFHNLPHIAGLAFVKAGLVTAEKGLVRGNHRMFELAYFVCIGFGAFEGLLNLVKMILRVRRVKKNPFNHTPVTVTFLFIFLAGFIAGTVLLVLSSLTALKVPFDAKYGCEDFGCSNIMAIVVLCYTSIRGVVTLVAICILTCGKRCGCGQGYFTFASYA